MLITYVLSNKTEFTYKRTADIAVSCIINMYVFRYIQLIIHITFIYIHIDMAKIIEFAATLRENANLNDNFINQFTGEHLDKKRRMVGTKNLRPCLVDLHTLLEGRVSKWTTN